MATRIGVGLVVGSLLLVTGAVAANSPPEWNQWLGGNQLWQRAEESDGQLLSYGPWLIYFHDRIGVLEICSVDQTGMKVRQRQSVCRPTRSETPLTFSQGVLYLRLPEELVALKLDPSVNAN